MKLFSVSLAAAVASVSYAIEIDGGRDLNVTKPSDIIAKVTDKVQLDI